jgi:hypothetical protein
MTIESFLANQPCISQLRRQYSFYVGLLFNVNTRAHAKRLHKLLAATGIPNTELLFAGRRPLPPIAPEKGCSNPKKPIGRFSIDLAAQIIPICERWPARNSH